MQKFGGDIFKPTKDKLNLLNKNEVDDWFKLNKLPLQSLLQLK